jgi:hypothetical protein
MLRFLCKAKICRQCSRSALELTGIFWTMLLDKTLKGTSWLTDAVHSGLCLAEVREGREFTPGSVQSLRRQDEAA